MVDLTMLKGWYQGQQGKTTVGHDLVWSLWVDKQPQPKRIQFDTNNGGYQFGEVKHGMGRTRREIKVATYVFVPQSPVFDTPQAAAMWAEIEGLTR